MIVGVSLLTIRKGKQRAKYTKKYLLRTQELTSYQLHFNLFWHKWKDYLLPLIDIALSVPEATETLFWVGLGFSANQQKKYMYISFYRIEWC